MRERRVLYGFAISTIKPGSLLKSQINLSRNTAWNDNVIGYLEIDLVSQWRSTAIECINSFNCTDFHSTWTESKAVTNLARTLTLNAMKAIGAILPLPVVRIDPDNSIAQAFFDLATGHLDQNRKPKA